MNLSFVLWLLVAGAGVGFINGMFGVGGCFLMVPTMFFLFTGLGVPTDTAMKVALGTNMAVVVPTALSGVLRHARIKKFSLPHYWNFAIPVGVGSLVGSGIAVFVPGGVLKVLFGLLCLVGAWRFMTAKPRPVDQMPPVERTRFWPTGFGGGFVAHFLGIGGGLVYVPALNTILGVPIHQAVALSQATMVIGSSVGAMTFIVLGLLKGVSDLPSLSLGYFNLVAWLALAATSIPMAQVGAVAAHKMIPKRLKFLLALLYIYVGLKLIGLFKWLGLPL
ncbi:MAG TPA: sulfite exporter TauE/SafE family protein [Anaerolineae bacterium]|nr:sulfite exporter TauE/SafE family protein [Anaerolineae bacterium]